MYGTDAGEARLIGIKGQPAPYALYRELSGQEAEVHLAAEAVDDLRFDPVFTSLFALERQMIRRDSMILHCAYIKYCGAAILFSAPSETGKSTQAGLWEKYRGSETVNGDRALLRKIDGRWTACGWPVCGSSEICHLGGYSDPCGCHAAAGEREPCGTALACAGVRTALQPDYSQSVEQGVCSENSGTD